MIRIDNQRTTVIIIPAYQPSEKLLESTNQLAALDLTIVVIDDGSELEYQQIFSRLDNNIHLLQHEENLGKGAALKTGYRYVDETFKNYTIVTADADGQHAVDDIEKVVRAYADYRGELLLGARAFDGKVPLRSKFGNVLTKKIMSLATRRNISDTQTGLRAFDDSLTDFMVSVSGDRFQYETNVLLECSRQNVQISEIEIKTIYEDNNSSSHFNPITDSLAIYKEILKFASSSLLAFAVDYLLFVLILQATESWAIAASVAFANILARIVSASLNFSINKHLIFRHDGKTAQSAFRYFLLAVGIVCFNTMILFGLTQAGLNPYISKVSTEILLFLLSYTVQKNFVFPNRLLKKV